MLLVHRPLNKNALTNRHRLLIEGGAGGPVEQGLHPRHVRSVRNINQSSGPLRLLFFSEVSVVNDERKCHRFSTGLLSL
jgi:hypothetical protein